jgi:hypothetical protein
MTNLTHADLDSQLIDLTAVPLDELRSLSTSALIRALEHTYAVAEFTTGNELQEQDKKFAN